MSANRACDYCEEEILPDEACDTGEHHESGCCSASVEQARCVACDNPVYVNDGGGFVHVCAATEKP